MYFFGMDVGTSSCKCVAFDSAGNEISSALQEYKLRSKDGGLDPDVLFQVVCDTVASCYSGIEDKSQDDLVFLTVSSFGESFVPVDKHGQVLAEVAMYTDNRGSEQLERLCDKLPHLQQIAGAAPNTMYALPKMMWAWENKFLLRQKLWKFMQISDYVVYRLTGNALIDYSLACRSLAFDIRVNEWSVDILSAAGLHSDMLSTPVPAGTIAGAIDEGVSSRMGLPANTQVVVGAHDQVVSALGAGALKPGQAVVGTGTVECLTPVFSRRVSSNEFLHLNYACIPYPADNSYVTYAFTMTGGALLKWFCDDMSPIKGQKAYATYDRYVSKGCGPLILVPHFWGSGTPELAAKALGTVTGLNLETQPHHLYTAILEGLCFELMYNRNILKQHGIEFVSLSATGGGARSQSWLQMKADTLGVPVSSLANPNAGCVGGAMLAAVAAESCTDLNESASLFVRTDKTYTPNATKKRYYSQKFKKYTALRQAMMKHYDINDRHGVQGKY